MLRFLQDYRGRATNEKFFRAGDEVDQSYLDETYLVGNGICERVEADAKDLESLTVAELRELAKAAEVEGYYDMRKAELIEALSE